METKEIKLRGRVLSFKGTFLLFFLLYFAPAIIGGLIGGKYQVIGFSFSFIFLIYLFGSNLLDTFITHKIKEEAKIVGKKTDMNVLIFEFQGENHSSWVPHERWFFEKQKIGDTIPVVLCIGKLTKCIRDIRPILGNE
jgi:hypothetical protein